MPSLWGILGYDDLATRIAASIRDTNDLTLLQGPPGVGKSWLVKGIGALWEQSGGSVVVAEGDLLRSGTARYPLGFGLAELSSAWRSLGAPSAGATNADEALAAAAKTLASTVRTLARLWRNPRRTKTLFLGDAEQQILFELERVARRRPLLLIADNLHWWDQASLELLATFRQTAMREAFAFLKEMRVLAVQTPEPYQRVADKRSHDAFLAREETTILHLPRVPRGGFKDVLVSLGARPEPTDEMTGAIYALTGGHLALAARCANRVSAGEGHLFLEAADTGNFVARLLTERIRSLGSQGADALRILQIAAVLGLRFRRDELDCAWEGDQSATSSLLRFLSDEDVVELSENVGRFVHELYREHVLSFYSFDRTGIHERLSDCLRRLSPGDYSSRVENAVRAGRHREAAELAVRAGLARLRDGLPWRELPPTILSALTHGEFDSAMRQFERAYWHLESDRHGECRAALSGLPRAIPEALLAESDYLRGICLMSTRSEADRATARLLLEAWEGLESTEPELGIRIMLLRLYGLTMLCDKREGILLEGSIRRVLSRRAGYDRAAEDAMYTLDRCSPSLYGPDVSLVRTREATDHFGPRIGQELVRRPVEYYRCLVNLAAEQVVNARYDEARETSRRIERLVQAYTDGVFPRLDHPLSTALLAEYRLGTVGPLAAAQRQRGIIAAHGVAGDPFYTQNSLAVYLALSGLYDEALQLYEALLGGLLERPSPEPSMEYLLRANRCAVSFVAGRSTDVVAEWTDLADLVRAIPYPIAPMLVRRHDLLTDVFETATVMSAQQFDECLVSGRRPEFGPMWDQLGRGFRMPEVMFWR